MISLTIRAKLEAEQGIITKNIASLHPPFDIPIKALHKRYRVPG